MPPSLSADAIRSTLSTRCLGQRMELHDEVDSTSREAVRLVQAGVEHGTVVLADTQTAGRGRLSRQWFSPPGVNIYCSIVLINSAPLDRLSDCLSWLPLLTALAASEAIEMVSTVAVSVKWPNDLLIGERKVGGILCESGPLPGSKSFQVIGVGLNVNGKNQDFPAELRDGATTIRHESTAEIDRNRVIAQLLNELEQCLEEYATRGSERIAQAYNRRCSTLGKRIKASLTGGQDFIALARSIGPDGSLIVEPHRPESDVRREPIRHLRAADIIHLRT
ncbi:putative Biotin-(Acetyl-CoA-carboxylase) ligase [Nitrospira sp. KM1]|uniref:biotin--[acetyl-CoA-carboxylase] ligase n=1 Tax=Nitrospira sp. KM1 TaxID=1936990 RepID=UPI0013A74FF3|nr:biotin--[acetyl-CoA-carboxylase] ligase [Nitrospira sp. KM1]BCA53172.1 putative Biotin-(Acetyl-CoA-carboxylase) ligase [Nitrospira sp. KM1]